MGLFSKCEKICVSKLLKAFLLFTIAVISIASFFMPLGVLDQISHLHHFDKIFHFIVFTLFALSIPFSQSVFNKVMYFILLVTFGIGIEAFQYYTPDRGASLQDLLANTLGILFGYTIRSFTQRQREGSQ